MKKPNILDRAIMTMAPVHAATRAAARVALSVIKSGDGSYGANLTKKSMRGWMYHGGSAKEDIEDNIDILRQRSRDAYMGIPTATAALKTMRTNVVAGGLMPAPQLDSDYLGLDETAVEKLQAQFVREFALWADTPVCDAERMDNFYQLQQLAFLSYLMNGDTIALLPMKHQAGAPYDLRVRLIEADRVYSPDGFDRLMPCTVQGYEVQSIVQGVETDADGSGRHGDGILDMQPASAGQQQRRGRGGADVAKSGSLRRYNRAAERAAHHEPRAHRPAAGRSPAGPCAGEPETAWTLHGRGDHGGGAPRAGDPGDVRSGLVQQAAADLVPDDVIIGLVTERLGEPDTEKGFILDGFPRTSAQAVALDAELSKLGRPLSAALLIDVDSEVIVKRLTSRRMCKDCGFIGSEANAQCPKCGGEMYQRDDDNEATVRNRLDVYEKSTSPLIDYYRGCDLLVSIDGDRDPNVVYADVKKALEL